MASFHFSANFVSRGRGQSAVAKAAYNAREKLENEKTGEVHDYTRAKGLMFEGIFAPKDAPDWARDRQTLWTEAERFENRKNSQIARTFDIALPHELTDEQRRQMVTDFVRENFVRKGMVADVVIHAPDRDGDERNFHAHILTTKRAVGPDGFGSHTLRHLEGPKQLDAWREKWARTANHYLERYGHEARIDHRSLEAQGIDREPTQHLGPTATQMEREGEPSERGDINRDIEARNKERESLKAERREVSHALREPGRENDENRRSEITSSRVKAEVSGLWAWAKNGADFAKALEARGYILAQSDKRDFVIIDGNGYLHSVTRRTGATADEVRAKLADIDKADLPTVGQAKEIQHERREREDEVAIEKAFTSGGDMVSQQQAAMQKLQRQHEETERQRKEARAKWGGLSSALTSGDTVTTIPTAAALVQNKGNETSKNEPQERQKDAEQGRQQEQSSFAGRKDTGQQKREDKTARTEQTDKKQGQKQSQAERLWNKRFETTNQVEREQDRERERER